MYAQISWGRGLARMALLTVSAFALPAFTLADGDQPTISLIVEAASSIGEASFSMDINDGNLDIANGTFSFQLLSPIELVNENDEVIAVIQGLGTSMEFDPLVGLNFVVLAGAADTSFNVQATLGNLTPVDPAEGRAFGGLVGTDITGDGVSIQGNFGPGTSVFAGYNAGPTQQFASFANGVSSPDPFTSVSTMGEFPPVGFSPIGPAVDRLVLEFAFALSAGDSAGGNGVFVVVPEPATGLALFALPFLRRRR